MRVPSHTASISRGGRQGYGDPEYSEPRWRILIAECERDYTGDIPSYLDGLPPKLSDAQLRFVLACGHMHDWPILNAFMRFIPRADARHWRSLLRVALPRRTIPPW